MSVLSFNGEPWAAGLVWIPHKRRRGLIRQARANSATCYVRSGQQVGLAGDQGGDHEEVVSLAAALRESFTASSWIAAVADDDGKIALIRLDDDEFHEASDEVHESREDVVRLLEYGTGPANELHASPTLDLPGASPLILRDIPVSDDMRLQAIPFASSSSPAVLQATAVLAVVALLTATGWFYGPAIWEFFVPPPPPLPEQVLEEAPTVTIAVDSAALLEACDTALQERPPQHPAWRLERVTCWASLTDAAILALRPELRDRPALVLRWALESGRDIALNRRLIEDTLSMRTTGFVRGRQAWAVTELMPVLVRWKTEPGPTFLELRAAIDRQSGPWSTSISYEETRTADWAITITGDGPLARVRQALADVPGLEVLSLTRSANGEWRIAGRPLRPRTILESAFANLAQPIAAGVPPAEGETHANP